MRDFDIMASIPATDDDREMWACEGAIAELIAFIEYEATGTVEIREARADIARPRARHRGLVERVRC